MNDDLEPEAGAGCLQRPHYASGHKTTLNTMDSPRWHSAKLRHRGGRRCRVKAAHFECGSWLGSRWLRFTWRGRLWKFDLISNTVRRNLNFLQH